MNTKEVGDKAEQIAADYLEQIGYEIVARQYSYKKLGEIDIIAFLNSTYIFVEVRYRTSTAFGTPEATLGPGKLRRIRRTATMWRLETGTDSIPCRFDVVAIDLAMGDPDIRHLKACF